MSLRVDFLNKSERRYQGIVSTKVMVLGSVSVLLGTSLLVLAFAMLSKATHTSNLKRTQRQWERVNPLAATVRQNGVAAEANKKELKRLEAWTQGSSAPMYTILREVQKELPEKIQLNSLRAGILEAPKESSYYMLWFSGRAMGELVAVETKRTLNDNQAILAFCGNIRLVSSQRESGDIWTFALEGRREEKGTP